MLFKHNKYAGIVDVVHTAVVEQRISSVFRGGPEVTGISFGVAAHQNPTNKHGASSWIFSVAVRVLSIPGKITACKRVFTLYLYESQEIKW